MEQIISVKKISEKEATNGSKYLLIETDLGKFGCWAPQLFPQLKPYEKYKVLTEQNDKYKNIIGVIESLGKEEVKVEQIGYEKDNTKMASVCVSYAKDLVVAGKIDISQMETFAKEFAKIIKEVSK